MRTLSHFLLTVVGQKQLKDRGVQVHVTAVLLGSVLPDIPLFLLMAGALLYYRWIVPLAEAEKVRLVHEELYFSNPFWIVGHNFFHGPLLVLLLLVLGYWRLRTCQPWGAAFFWYAVGSSFHTLIDVFTHHGDGPLLLFPFNWVMRFNSPVSYWDPRYYGAAFTVMEYALDVVFLLYLLVEWVRRRHGALSPSQMNSYMNTDEPEEPYRDA